MAIQVDEIRIDHRLVGSTHVFTSPDVPELHISHTDEAVARADLQPALDAIERMRLRIDARRARAELLRGA